MWASSLVMAIRFCAVTQFTQDTAPKQPCGNNRAKTTVRKLLCRKNRARKSTQHRMGVGSLMGADLHRTNSPMGTYPSEPSHASQPFRASPLDPARVYFAGISLPLQSNLFPDVRHQSHESGALDCRRNRVLAGRGATGLASPDDFPVAID